MKRLSLLRLCGVFTAILSLPACASGKVLYERDEGTGVCTDTRTGAQAAEDSNCSGSKEFWENGGHGIVTAFLKGKPLFAKITHAKIAYQVFGEGPALVLLHGWPLNRHTWRNLLPYLVRHFTVYLIDEPGAGDTLWKESADFSWPGQARSIQEFLRSVGVERYFLFGQDSGAMIARELALIDGPRVLKLAMANTEIPNHRPPEELVDAQAKMSAFWPGLITTFLRYQLSRESFLRSKAGFGGCFKNPEFIFSDFHRHILEPLLLDHRKTEGARRFLAGWNWERLDEMGKLHQRIDAPVLLIWGVDDETFPLVQAEEMRTQFPAFAGLVEIPNARLLVHEERPRQVAEALIRFFE